ncbi:Leucine zipper-EF-hand-containing transmembrane protein 1 mitochondrial [Fasciola hepatica]|uniref:Mitochondrial proton/calcium exchanger protein n=1 Tax=Fasciola hepatica TaxID=6192 RepID=A0A4E0RHR0_FASHE|nr:Leucine zipper-EF-hand-containing transmembrane protein 1 mitochondrial [Fasciola hepatica]
MLVILRNVARPHRVRVLCPRRRERAAGSSFQNAGHYIHNRAVFGPSVFPTQSTQWNLSLRSLHLNSSLWSGTETTNSLRVGDSRPEKYHPSLFLVDNPPPETSSKKPPAKSESSSSALSETPEDPEKNESNTEQKKLSMWQKVKKEVAHYYHGFRLLGLEVKIASGICIRLLCGNSLTRRERKQLVRTVADIIRLVPFAVFIIVPFMEFLLPFYLKFFPFMLPSTFKYKSTEAEKIRQRVKAKLEMTRFLQETLHHTTGAVSEGEKSPSFEQFQGFLKKVQESGQFLSDEEITRFSKLFEDQITLDSLELNQLKMLCRLLSLPTMGPSNLLRFQLQMRVRQLKAEDRLLAKEGVNTIPAWELQTLCQDRGMRSVGLTEERLRNQLAQWLNLHLEKNVPVTLLLFSRALHVSKASTAELPLKEAIAQLPTAASEEATARVLESALPTELDPRTKIELLRKEQANIKAARIQRKQELAEQKKAAASELDAKSAREQKLAPAAEDLVDKAPVLKGLPKEELENVKEAPSVSVVSTTEEPLALTIEGKKSQTAVAAQATPTESTSSKELQLKEALKKVLAAKVTKEEEPEITVVDLAQIESAIAESSGALHEEAMEGLKEEVAETATKHTASLVSADRTVDKRTTKAAQRLASRVGRMIGEMDTMMDKLAEEKQQLLKNIELHEVHVKHSTEPTEKSEILDAIKADHERVVDINDLLLALRRLQKVPDDTRWQKILDVLDEDHDGKIEMQHVLSVIELLGAENVKLSSKEIKRVLEMVDNEHLAEIVQSQEIEDEARKTAAVDNTTTEQFQSESLSSPGSSTVITDATTTGGISASSGAPKSSDSTISNQTDRKR